MEAAIQLPDDNTRDYLVRCGNRMATIGKATMALYIAYLTAGDTSEVAKGKVQQISQKISFLNGGAKMDYQLGDTQPLIDTVQSINDLDFFTQTEKDIVINILTNG